MVVLGPVIFYMLEEFAVPGRVDLVAFLPVEDELRHQGAGKFSIDVRKAKNIVEILAGLPLVADAPWLGAVLHA